MLWILLRAPVYHPSAWLQGLISVPNSSVIVSLNPPRAFTTSIPRIFFPSLKYRNIEWAMWRIINNAYFVGIYKYKYINFICHLVAFSNHFLQVARQSTCPFFISMLNYILCDVTLTFLWLCVIEDMRDCRHCVNKSETKCDNVWRFVKICDNLWHNMWKICDEMRDLQCVTMCVTICHNLWQDLLWATICDKYCNMWRFVECQQFVTSITDKCATICDDFWNVSNFWQDNLERLDMEWRWGPNCDTM